MAMKTPREMALVDKAHRQRDFRQRQVSVGNQGLSPADSTLLHKTDGRAADAALEQAAEMKPADVHHRCQVFEADRPIKIIFDKFSQSGDFQLAECTLLRTLHRLECVVAPQHVGCQSGGYRVDDQHLDGVRLTVQLTSRV